MGFQISEYTYAYVLQNFLTAGDLPHLYGRGALGSALPYPILQSENLHLIGAA